MKVTVKDLKQNSSEFDNIDPNQTVSEFANLVKEELKFVDDVRLIYCGRILDNDKPMSEYFKDTNNGFIVCMPMKKPPAPNSTLAVNSSVSNPSAVNRTSNSLPVMQPSGSTETYTADQVHAVLMLFYRILKISPDLFYLFSTNDKLFQEFMLSPVFSNQLLKHMLDNSATIVTAVQNGQDIAVPIPMYSYGNLSRTQNSQNMQNTQNTSNLTSSVSLNTTNPETTNDDNSNGDGDNLFSTLNTDTSTLSSTLSSTLTDQDRQNIQDLCQLGFAEDIVTQTYLMTNKNKELTAGMLFEFS